MRNETHKRARWRSAIIKKGERERERGGGREVKHYRGKESRAGKTVFKNATNDKQQHDGQHTAATAHTRTHTFARAQTRAHIHVHTQTEGAVWTGKRQRRRQRKKGALFIPVSSSKGSTWLCLEMKTGVVDNKVGWRFVAVPHCKAAVAQSRL